MYAFTSLVYNRPFNPIIHTPLILHGYAIHDRGTLGPLADAVCQTALPLLMKHPQMVAILLGGWRLHDPGPSTTIADGMQQWLLEHGVQRYQMITQRNIGLCRFMPPRDIWEELTLLQHIMGVLDQHAQCDLRFVAWDFHIPRLTRIYENFFPGQPTIAFPATPRLFPQLNEKIFIERMARLVQWADSDGTGVVCRKARARRTLAQQGIPLIP